MEDSAMEPTLPRKEQEFIDHTLLAPTYIRDSSNFIIDLMEHPAQIVFPKTVVHVPPSTSVPSSSSGTDSYAIKVSNTDALPPDLQFHNTIFHFRQEQSEVTVGSGADALSALAVGTQTVPVSLVGSANGNNESNGNGYKHTHAHTSDFITLNGDFLATGDQKSYCDAVVQNPTGAETVPQFLLAPSNVALDESNVLHDGSDVLYARSNARKVLPHKKRISRKLRVSQSCDDDILPQPLGGHKLQEVEERLGVGNLNFSCEICGHTTITQLQFFEHLKQHYEPTTPDTILAAMKTSLEELQPVKDCENLCELSKKASDSNVDQVFNDVHLNFDDFHSVAETVRHVMDGGSQDNDIKILNSNGISKCMDYVSQATTSPLKDITPDEVEFSDTEDMLEGIRNVVDKVSIEDTCDDIDLMSSSGIRAPWFTSDNFSGITFKSKPFGDVSFGESLSHIPVIENNDMSVAPKEQQLELKIPPPERYSDDKAELHIPIVSENAHNAFDSNDMCIKPTGFNSGASLSCEQAMNAMNETVNLQTKEQAENFTQNNSADLYNTEDALKMESTTGGDSATDSEHEQDDEHNDEYEDNDETENYTTNAKTGKKQYICSKCPREFNSSNALKYHNRTHSGVRPHQCDTCGKSFFAQGALKSHMRTHTGDKPFECEYCQRKFRQWGDLKYHTISIHTEEKSHQCEFCGKAFSRKYSLVLHRRIHTSERNYKCEFCVRTFRASTYLQNHRKIHTGEKPHECTVCSKRFRVSGDLRRHMRIHQRESVKAAPAPDAKAGAKLID